MYSMRDEYTTALNDDLYNNQFSCDWGSNFQFSDIHRSDYCDGTEDDYLAFPNSTDFLAEDNIDDNILNSSTMESSDLSESPLESSFTMPKPDTMDMMYLENNELPWVDDLYHDLFNNPEEETPSIPVEDTTSTETDDDSPTEYVIPADYAPQPDVAGMQIYYPAAKQRFSSDSTAGDRIMKPVKRTPKKSYRSSRSPNHHKKPRCPITSTSTFPKPPFSYSTLIGLALNNHPSHRATVSQIYAFIAYNFPYFADAAEGWKNSIRHNLSLKSGFEKILADDNGPCNWALTTAGQKKIMDEAERQKFDQVTKSLRQGATFEQILGGVQGLPGEEFVAKFLRPSSPKTARKQKPTPGLKTINGARSNLGLVLSAKVEKRKSGEGIMFTDIIDGHVSASVSYTADDEVQIIPPTTTTQNQPKWGERITLCNLRAGDIIPLHEGTPSEALNRETIDVLPPTPRYCVGTVADGSVVMNDRKMRHLTSRIRSTPYTRPEK